MIALGWIFVLTCITCAIVCTEALIDICNLRKLEDVEYNVEAAAYAAECASYIDELTEIEIRVGPWAGWAAKSVGDGFIYSRPLCADVHRRVWDLMEDMCEFEKKHGGRK